MTDQFFSEAQFESYRELGWHAIEEICGRDWKVEDNETPCRLHERAERYAKQPADWHWPDLVATRPESLAVRTNGVAVASTRSLAQRRQRGRA